MIEYIMQNPAQYFKDLLFYVLMSMVIGLIFGLVLLTLSVVVGGLEIDNEPGWALAYLSFVALAFSFGVASVSFGAMIIADTTLRYSLHQKGVGSNHRKKVAKLITILALATGITLLILGWHLEGIEYTDTIGLIS